MGQLLRDLATKIQNSNIKPIIKYPLLAVVFAGIGACVFYGVA